MRSSNFRQLLIRSVSATTILVTLISITCAFADDAKTIQEKTKIHLLSTTKRAPFDAFVYVNRIPESPGEGETADDFSGRIFGRLANQEGRILLKLPPGMNRDTYIAFKTFFRYQPEGKAAVGNCAACHTPTEFTDFLHHIVNPAGEAKPTPSLRNLKATKDEIKQAIIDKIALAEKKRSGSADQIDQAYAKIQITLDDVPGLVDFLSLLNDVTDSEFRDLILNATVLDTSQKTE